MSRKTRAGAAAALAALAIAAAAAIPSLTGAQTAGPREITVHMKVRGGVQIPHRKGDTMRAGDRLIVRLAMFAPSGDAVGSAHTACTNVGRKAPAATATLHCVQTYEFGDGQIATAGVARFSELEQLSIPIVGGSGAYRGARGELRAGAPVEGFESVDVLRLDG